MKTTSRPILTSYIIAATYLLYLSSCIKPFEPTPQPPLTLPCDTCLPPITTPGFACKINGKPFISKFGGGGFITTRFDYYEQNLFVRGNNPDIKEAIAFNLMPLVDTGLYEFPNNLLTHTNSGYGDWYGNFEYSTRPIQKGYVYLSKLDSLKGSIQGTFAFDLYSKDFKDTVHITDGRFFLNK